MSHRGGSGSWVGPWPAGWTVEQVAATGSTNADLLATAGGRPDRSVLVADHQSAGRGRLDRRWEAPPGANLLVSVLFTRRDPTTQPGELVRRISLAALDACRRLVPDAGAVALKWPNDLLLDGRKLAGVLAQGNGDGDVVVGLGLNVGWAPEGAGMLGAGTDRVALLRALLECYDALSPDPGALHERYRRELATIGQRVRVERPAGDLEGRAVDVDATGRLVVLDRCAVSHHVDVGDITHLRPVTD